MATKPIYSKDSIITAGRILPGNLPLSLELVENLRLVPFSERMTSPAVKCIISPGLSKSSTVPSPLMSRASVEFMILTFNNTPTFDNVAGRGTLRNRNDRIAFLDNID